MSHLLRRHVLLEGAARCAPPTGPEPLPGHQPATRERTRRHAYHPLGLNPCQPSTRHPHERTPAPCAPPTGPSTLATYPSPRERTPPCAPPTGPSTLATYPSPRERTPRHAHHPLGLAPSPPTRHPANGPRHPPHPRGLAPSPPPPHPAKAPRHAHHPLGLAPSPPTRHPAKGHRHAHHPLGLAPSQNLASGNERITHTTGWNCPIGSSDYARRRCDAVGASTNRGILDYEFWARRNALGTSARLPVAAPVPRPSPLIALRPLVVLIICT